MIRVEPGEEEWRWHDRFTGGAVGESEGQVHRAIASHVDHAKTTVQPIVENTTVGIQEIWRVWGRSTDNHVDVWENVRVDQRLSTRIRTGSSQIAVRHRGTRQVERSRAVADLHLLHCELIIKGWRHRWPRLTRNHAVGITD